jgi:arabinose-5-phosphate isomerase
MTLQVHDPEPSTDRLEYARQIVRAEAAALEKVADRLDESFEQAVELIYDCRGSIAITGAGKSADVGQKIAGTFNSTGTRSYLLDATRAVHGDLGMIHPNDVAMILSHSGESEEVVRLLAPLKTMTAAVICMTSNRQSTLADQADVALVLGPLEEVCPLGLAPSTSTTAMIAVGDALSFVLSRMRSFSHEDFARFHPAGSLGRRLIKVDAVMRRGEEMRLAQETETVRAVFGRARKPGRRTGAVILTDSAGRLTGLFTDSDLARLFEKRHDAAMDRPVCDVMTPRPITIDSGSRVTDAAELMRRQRISELPVIDPQGHAVGVLDITDLHLLGLLPREEAVEVSRVA